jgi:hypothetical protein
MFDIYSNTLAKNLHPKSEVKIINIKYPFLIGTIDCIVYDEDNKFDHAVEFKSYGKTKNMQTIDTII